MSRTIARVPARPSSPATSWPELVERAVADGIVSIEQAEQLRALVPAGPVPSAGDGAAGRLRARVAEALGYVGASLVVVAGALTAQQFWADLRPWSHVALAGMLALVLLVAGAAVEGQAGTPLGRLGSFLWAVAVVAVAGTASLVADELLELEEAAYAVTTFAPATVAGLVLWWARVRALQQLVVVVGVIATSTALLALLDVELEVWGGILVWAIGVAWLALAWGRVVHPSRTGRVAGAIASLLGPLMAFGAPGRFGVVLGVVTAGGLVAASVPARETVLLGLGVLGLFVFVPNAVFEFFGDQLGAPVALLASGVVLLGVSLWIARARRDTSPGR